MHACVNLRAPIKGYVTPALQWTHIYCPSEAFLMFGRYFALTKTLYVD